MLALAGIIIALGFTQVINLDIWWHLKTGEVIWRGGQIPQVDLFSYTAPGAPWTNHEWLFEVIAWALFSAGGIATLTLLKGTLTAGIAWVAFRTFRILNIPLGSALLGTFVLLIGIMDRIMCRPFLFTLFFFALFALCLHAFAAGRLRRLWFLPPLTIIWINLHGGGIIGPQLLFVYALGEAIQSRLAARGWAPAPRLDRSQRVHLWVITLLCIIACLINPWGVNIFTFPLEHLHMQAILTFTHEWFPTLDARVDDVISHILFRAMLVGTLISYLINARRVPLSHLLLTLLTCMLIAKAKRFTPQFLIINLPLMWLNLHEALGPHLSRLRRWGNRPTWLALAVVMELSLLTILYGVPASLGGRMHEPIGFGTSIYSAPTRMVDFLEENQITGNVFNEMGLGGYLIFRRWPQERVFIDGRTPVYGDRFYDRYTDFVRSSRNFQQLDDRYHFDYLVFKTIPSWDLRYVHEHLWRDPKWRLVYMQDDGIVYVRNTPRFRTIIDRFELKQNPLIEMMNRTFGKKEPAPDKQHDSISDGL